MRRLLLAGLMLTALSSAAQNTKKATPAITNISADDATTLASGDTAAWNMSEAESAQIAEDPSFVPPKPQMEEKVTQPGTVIFRNPDGTDRLEMDWTVGQHARSLMEELRISMWRYQAGKANPGGVIGVGQAVDVWPKLRAIFCREYPGGRYIDLQGQAQYCEEARARGNAR